MSNTGDALEVMPSPYDRAVWLGYIRPGPGVCQMLPAGWRAATECAAWRQSVWSDDYSARSLAYGFTGPLYPSLPPGYCSILRRLDDCVGTLSANLAVGRPFGITTSERDALAAHLLATVPGLADYARRWAERQTGPTECQTAAATCRSAPTSPTSCER